MLVMKSVASVVGSDSSYRLFDDMPISVMLCELDDFKITYINESTRQNLKKIEHVLPVKVDALIGQSIDIFHRNPQHQRRLLSDPKNLPHKARITIGGETLDLTVTAMTSSRGRYTGPMLTWELATEKARLETQTERLLQMLDNMPINIMMCDTDFNITYINQTSLKTLDTVKHLLPVAPDKILGNSFDIFHKNPAHQRRIVGDPKNLPHAAKIKLGPETLDLRVSGLTDKRGNYTGAMLSWSVVTGNVKLADDFEKDVKGLAGMLASASTQMQGTARSLTTTAEFVNQRSASAASASEELSSSVNEISRQVAEASRMPAWRSTKPRSPTSWSRVS
ncbi:PAS domain-containing protein [Bradyrhizobium pachyrhizi]|uniref:PAS domain-containing protein n=1 Tax=Bradyrhizobium pachyrhizi TaxID=280333 RepID=UPI003D35E2C6